MILKKKKLNDQYNFGISTWLFNPLLSTKLVRSQMKIITSWLYPMFMCFKAYLENLWDDYIHDDRSNYAFIEIFQ
jgi:hypothetical protein